MIHVRWSVSDSNVQMKVDCSFKKDMLKGDQANEIRIEFVEFLDDSTQFMLNDV